MRNARWSSGGRGSWPRLVPACSRSLCPLLPWVGAGNAADARSTMALILAATLVSAGALGLGSSMIGPDLGERRLGFYFARPLGAAAIWWGKLVATFLVVFLAGVLVLSPTALQGRRLGVGLAAGGRSRDGGIAGVAPAVLHPAAGRRGPRRWPLTSHSRRPLLASTCRRRRCSAWRSGGW